MKSTEKHLKSLKAIPYLTDSSLRKKSSRRERAEFQNCIAGLARIFEREGYDVSGKNEEEVREKIYGALMKNGLVGKGDIGLLAAGIDENKKYDTFLFGRDSHLRDAIRALKKAEPKEVARLHYLEFQDAFKP